MTCQWVKVNDACVETCKSVIFYCSEHLKSMGHLMGFAVC